MIKVVNRIPKTLPINLDNEKSHDLVKMLLRHGQYGKCAYCECKLNGDIGHIEHYRPVKGYRSSLSGKLVKPGYLWLKNDPGNLLLSCSLCNSKYKGNHFALLDEATRDIAHCDISREEPMLISPVADAPEKHFAYDGYYIKPRLLRGVPDRRAAYTIDLLQLNSRAELVKNRKRVYDAFVRWLAIRFNSLAELASNPGNGPAQANYEEACAMIRGMMCADAEYAGMTRYAWRRSKRGKKVPPRAI